MIIFELYIKSMNKYSFLLLTLLLLVVEGRKLLQIHELFRHGARYPWKQPGNDYSEFAS